MTILVGADMQAIDEVQTSVANFGDRYLRRVFTDVEISDCYANESGAASALAGRFAAKEAVFKVLEGDVAMWQEIEVRLESGQPRLFLRGAAASLAKRRGIATMSLSMSHAGATAAAVVVAESSTRSDDQ